MWKKKSTRLKRKKPRVDRQEGTVRLVSVETECVSSVTKVKVTPPLKDVLGV